ncbi:MAG: TPM domain-containing protein [Chitinophagaceae bacterium]
MDAKNFLSPAEREDIQRSIAEAELQTSGEIRVHVEDTFKGEIMDRGKEVFKKLKMHETKENNGVLFYLAVKNRSFAIIADSGIDSKVPAGFWEAISKEMSSEFAQGRFVQGLITGITMSGEQLKFYFPRKSDDKNELSNDISFGE